MTTSTQHTEVMVQPSGPSDHPVVSVIQINTLEALLSVAVVLVGLGIAWGSLKTIVSGIRKTLDEEVKPELKTLGESLKNMRERFVVVEDRVETLWKDKVAPAHSPRQLNEKGENILKTSGIKEIVDEKRQLLLEFVRAKKALNAYDAEAAIEDVMKELPEHFPETVDTLKQGAFMVGANLDEVLFVGSIYLRNSIFGDLGFGLGDLDTTSVQ
jgi:hypothetical protein